MRFSSLSLFLTVAVAAACTGGGGSLDGEPDASIVGTSSSSSSSGGSSSSSGNVVDSGGPKGPTDVKDVGYSHACNTDADCVAVYFGDTCASGCNATTASIAQSSQASYQATFNAARANCPPFSGGGTCARYYKVTQCDASKTCQLVDCGFTPSVDEHHCKDGGI